MFLYLGSFGTPGGWSLLYQCSSDAYFEKKLSKMPNILEYTFSLSQRSPLFCGVYLLSIAVFLLHLFIIFGVGLHAYFSNHSPFSREHKYVCFNEFPSLVCWYTVIHHNRPQRPTLFRRMKWDFTCMQRYVYTDTGQTLFASKFYHVARHTEHPRR